MQQKKRIEYLDALRGFTMILVVMSHVALFNLGVDVRSDGCYHTYFQLFRMPLFFFVSGFVFYKSNVIWHLDSAAKFLGKKLTVQVLSPFLFFCCFLYCVGRPFLVAFTSENKSGYWFTFTLFYYFITYIVVRMVLHRMRVKENWALVVLLLMGALFYFYDFTGFLASLGVPREVLGALSMKKSYFFIFFVLGVCTRRSFSRFEHLLDTTHLLAVATLLFFTLNVFVDLADLGGFIKDIYKLLLALCGITITFALFRKKESFFASNKPVAVALKYIGRRTLDIYLLHYFFLSFNFKEICPLFVENSLPLLEFVTTLAMTALVIAASLFVSFILRADNILAHYLFGVKKEN